MAAARTTGCHVLRPDDPLPRPSRRPSRPTSHTASAATGRVSRTSTATRGTWDSHEPSAPKIAQCCQPTAPTAKMLANARFDLDMVDTSPSVGPPACLAADPETGTVVDSRIVGASLSIARDRFCRHSPDRPPAGYRPLAGRPECPCSCYLPGDSGDKPP